MEITFRNSKGQLIEARILARESGPNADPNAHMWVVELGDSERDHMVLPSQVVRWGGAK